MTSGMQKMEVRAPLSGVIVPLDDVPDPVFARRMVGDGVALEPTSDEVLAPVSGEVTQVHEAHHALVITAENGVQVMVHVGLDTVVLGGHGFTPLVAAGTRVEAGQPVLRFDADYLARHARSLLTAVTLSPAERLARLAPAQGMAVAGQSVLLTAELADPDQATNGAQDGPRVLSQPVRLPNAAGLHARPAAVLARAAKSFAARVRLVRGEQEANAKSVVSILGLSTRQDDALQVLAEGPDAAEAVETLTRLLQDGCGEKPGDWTPAPAVSRPAELEQRPRGAGPRDLAGAPASPGLALGRIFQYRHANLHVVESGGTPDEERARFRAAAREAARQIVTLREHAQERSKAQILDVHLALLEDPELIALTEGYLDQGKSAAFAWQQAFTRYAAQLEKLENELLRERAADVRDVGRRMLALLSGLTEVAIEIPEGSILVAEEISPSEMAAFDRGKLLGICTTTGGSTSHVAILARSMGLPAVCGIDEAALAIPDGTRVAIDGTHGLLRVRPDDELARQVEQHMARRQAQAAADAAAAFELARTRDGHRVEVVANVRNAREAAQAIAAGAEGVGLLRTEFLFDERTSAPDEEEQAEEYAAVARALGRERPLVIRTLDVGGDKPLPYLPLPRERNPFLGMRGIRVSLADPELLRTQLRAILRVAPLGNVHVMFPMVATLDELRAAKQILAEEQESLRHAVKVGVMIEVPSAAMMAEVLAREVDFFSIGTNDLTQYVLATDRGHPRLANLADAFHPAVLRMIAMTVEGAHEHGKWVGVCGGLASDTLATPLLAGLGVDELSVSVPDIASIKAALRRWSLDECTELASEVLRVRTAAEARSLLMARLESAAGSAPERVLS